MAFAASWLSKMIDSESSSWICPMRLRAFLDTKIRMFLSVLSSGIIPAPKARAFSRISLTPAVLGLFVKSCAGVAEFKSALGFLMRNHSKVSPAVPLMLTLKLTFVTRAPSSHWQAVTKSPPTS